VEVFGSETQEEIKTKRDEIVNAEKYIIINKDELEVLQQAIAEAINPEQKFNLKLDDTLSQQVKYIQTMFGEYFFMDLKGQKQLLYHLTRIIAIACIYAEKTLLNAREELVKKSENDYYNSVDEYFPERS